MLEQYYHFVHEPPQYYLKMYTNSTIFRDITHFSISMIFKNDPSILIAYQNLQSPTSHFNKLATVNKLPTTRRTISNAPLSKPLLPRESGNAFCSKHWKGLFIFEQSKKRRKGFFSNVLQIERWNEAETRFTKQISLSFTTMDRNTGVSLGSLGLLGLLKDWGFKK